MAPVSKLRRQFPDSPPCQPLVPVFPFPNVVEVVSRSFLSCVLSFLNTIPVIFMRFWHLGRDLS